MTSWNLKIIGKWHRFGTVNNFRMLSSIHDLLKLRQKDMENENIFLANIKLNTREENCTIRQKYYEANSYSPECISGFFRVFKIWHRVIRTVCLSPLVRKIARKLVWTPLIDMGAQFWVECLWSSWKIGHEILRNEIFVLKTPYLRSHELRAICN